MRGGRTAGRTEPGLASARICILASPPRLELPADRESHTGTEIPAPADKFWSAIALLLDDLTISDTTQVVEAEQLYRALGIKKHTLQNWLSVASTHWNSSWKKAALEDLGHVPELHKLGKINLQHVTFDISEVRDAIGRFLIDPTLVDPQALLKQALQTAIAHGPSAAAPEPPALRSRMEGFAAELDDAALMLRVMTMILDDLVEVRHSKQTLDRISSWAEKVGATTRDRLALARDNVIDLARSEHNEIDLKALEVREYALDCPPVARLFLTRRDNRLERMCRRVESSTGGAVLRLRDAITSGDSPESIVRNLREAMASPARTAKVLIELALSATNDRERSLYAFCLAKIDAAGAADVLLSIEQRRSDGDDALHGVDRLYRAVNTGDFHELIQNDASRRQVVTALSSLERKWSSRERTVEGPVIA